MKKSTLVLALALAAVMIGCGSTSPLQPQQHQAPVLTSTTPIVTATSQHGGVATDKKIFVKFNTPMDAATINSNSFYLEPNVASEVTYDAANRIAQLRPLSPLASNTTYRPTVSTAMKSAAGVSNPVSITFLVQTRSTPDVSVPSVEVVGEGCVNPSGPVRVHFSEEMDSSTINTTTFYVEGVSGSVTYDPVTNIASFTPDSPFAASTTYNAVVTTGAKDLGGVAIASDFHFSFTTCPEDQKSFCTYTKGGYAGGGTPGQIFDTYFPDVFENDLVIGINDGGGPLHSARWQATSPGPENLKLFLTSPALGSSSAFTADYVNPSATSNGQLPEQTAALTLNIGFSGVDGMPAGFGDLVLKNTGTSLDGATVNDILGFANYALAGVGLPSGYTYSSLNSLIDNLNQSWDNCQQSQWAADHLE